MENKLRVVFYLMVIGLVLFDDKGTVSPSWWYWSSKYWYGIAEFAGRQGLKAENNYHEAVKY